MRNLIVLGLVGLFAQLIDGSLGMAYGVTSSTLMLAVGISPAAASAAVHLSEVGTTLVSGAAHWKFGNVDWRIVGIMAVPGGIGAFFGATLLANINGDTAKPFVAILLMSLGGYVLWRFLRLGGERPQFKGKLKAAFLAPLGVVAGICDAIGGGGWGPVGTTSLLSSGKLEPRKVVGSIDTSEFVVAIGASLGFLFALGSQGINFGWVLALLIGGVIAAPVAAWLVRHLPARILGVAAGGIIVLTNLKTVLESVGIEGVYVALAAIAWTLIWAQMLLVSVRAERRSRAVVPEQAVDGVSA
ncbi:sulfite exporter TauE/SafE family protein [Solicola gregarius]|uniref:Probable membrane transporter protein n=1 Tax=Solicola gregarius TaxID=2908642 RepID=A0AA46TKQ3_9ACTN|nr:sulfite exporter TauE/SafE family protein [Solicola gregarius]UYM07104.1 sulfite exporter TauE/SafE family protein [Solicola gregarius]